ncbi:cytochrome P450 [Polyplosphaeria fusca]|uniref:Cytochrome P450 n=1 Tax=Polyplosphaeria fusca TaxID=682080 RepID=A0A9P4QGN8_9PLEO|nr:cytochrome P450 [Polyplosphaeria fusca]
MAYLNSYLVAIAASLVLLHIITIVLHRVFFNPLSRIPGPLLNALSSIPHDLACVLGKRHKYLTDLHDAYGPIVRVAPTEVSFIDPSIWRDVYGFHPQREECMKSDNHARLNGWTGILDAERADHRRMRRLLSHAFSEQSLRQQEERLKEQVDALVEGLKGKCRDGKVVDMCLWLQWTTFDIMGDLAFGGSFGSLAATKTHPWQQFLLDYIAAGLWTGIAERWGLKGFADWCAPPSLLRAVQQFHDLCSEKLMKRVKLGKERGDFLDHVLQHDLLTMEQEKGEDTKGLHMQELENIAADIAIAGSETSSTLLTGAIFYLLTNPRVLERVTAEVRTLRSDEDITLVATAKLPYFVAVLEEGLRIFHPVPASASRTAVAGGVTVGPYFIPKGSRMWPAHYVAYRSPLHFARPLEFLPERWLADKPEEFKEDNASGIYQPFSFGPRNCIGNNLARAEMRIMLAKLLWHFDLEKPELSTEDEKTWDGWMDRLKVYFLWEKPPLMVKLKMRSSV